MAYTYPVRTTSRPVRSNRNQDDEERRRREEEERRAAEEERAKQIYMAAGKERQEQELYDRLYGNANKSQEPEQSTSQRTGTRQKYPSNGDHTHGARPDSKQERIDMSRAEVQRRNELAAEKAARREQSQRRTDALYGYVPNSPVNGGTKQRIYWNLGNDPETAKKLDQFRYVFQGNTDPNLTAYERYMQANARNREVNGDDLTYSPLYGTGDGMTPEKWEEKEHKFDDLTENQVSLLDDLKTKRSQNESLEMMGSFVDDDGRIVSYANDAAKQEEEDIRNKLKSTGLSDDIIDEYLQNDGRPQRTIEEELQLDSYYNNQLDDSSKAVLNDYLDWDEKEKQARESGHIGVPDYETGTIPRNDADVAARQKELLKERFMYQTGQTEEEFELSLERARRVYDYNRNIDQQNELYAAQKEGGAGAAIGQNLAVIGGSLGQGLGAVKDTIKGQYDPAAPSNIYGDNFTGVNQAANIQQITAQNIGDAIEAEYGSKEIANILGHSITPRSVAEFAYQTGMSTAESAVQMAAMGPVAAISPTLAMSSFGYNAYASSLKENLEKGMTQSDAQTMALVSGAAEIITEKFSADRFWDVMKQSNATARKRLVDLVVSSVVEGSEEVASDVINDAADIILMGDYSENRKRYNEIRQKYLQDGMSEKEAERAAWGDFLSDKAYDYAESGLGGFISGGLHGATATAVNIAQTQKAANAALQNGDFGAVAEAISTNEEDYRNKSALDSAKAAKQMAEEYAEQKASGKEVSGRQVRKLYEAIQDALVTESETENSIEVPEPKAADEKFEQRVVDQYAGKGNNISARDAVAAMARAQTPEQLVMIRKAAEASRDSSARAAAQAAYQLNKGRIASENNLIEADFEAAENTPTESEAFEAGIRGDELAEGASEALQRAYKSGEMVSRLRAGREGANAAETVLKNGTEAEITGITGYGDNMVVHTSKGDVSVRDMRTSATRYLYEAASKYGSEEAAQNFIENYDGKMPVGRYTSIFDKYYAYGATSTEESKRFETVFNADKVTRQFMSRAQAESIYKFGQTERAAQLEKNAEEQGRSIAVRGTGVVKDNRKVKTDIEYMPVLEAMARATGMDIVLADDMADNINGTFNRAMQAITLNTKNKDNVLNTLFHEGFGEVIQAHNAEGAARVQQAVFDYISEDEDMLVRLGRAYQEAYIGVEGTKTFYDAMSEMVNDSIAGLFSTQEGIHDFAEWAQNRHGVSGAKTILQSTADYFKGIADSFKRLLQKGGLSKASQRTARMAEDRAREIRKMILQEMDVAIENARKAGIDPNAERTQAFSLQYDKTGRNLVGDDGRVYPIVDNNAFSDADVIANETTVAGLVQDALKALTGKSVVIKSDNTTVWFGGDFRGKYTHSQELSAQPVPDRTVKYNSYDSVRSLVENAVGGSVVYPDRNNKHGAKAGRGWRYYDGTLAVRAGSDTFDLYTGELQIRQNSRDGKDYVYDWRTPTKTSSLVTVTQSKDSLPHGGQRSNSNVSQGRHSVNVDSAGNALSEAQAEYFKDSKVRDENGNLLLVHHGTNAEFYEFDRNYIGSHGSFEGAGFNFTPSEARAGGYKGIGSGEGRIMSGYLNITSPLSDSKVTMSAGKLAKLIRDIDPTGDDIISNYARDTRDYGSPSFISRESLYTARQIINYSESDADIYSEMSSAGADANTIIEAFKAQGYDGLIHHTDDGKIKTLISFDSNQFKNKDNTSPTASGDIRHSINAAMQDIYGDNVQIETDQNGEFQLATAEGSDTIIFNDANIRHSLQTLDNTQNKLAKYLKSKGHDQEDIDTTLGMVKSMAQLLEDVSHGYKEMDEALHTDVIYDITGTRQVLRSLLKNGEYPVNFDFMTICKKRQAYMRVLTDLIDDGTFEAVNYNPMAIAAVNDILRNNGYETACLACFVESRRLQIQKWSETFCEAWNRQVEKVAGKNALPFDFGKNARGTTSYSQEEIQKLAEEFDNGGKKNDKGNLNLGTGAVEEKMGRLLEKMPTLARTIQPGDILKTNGVANLRGHYGEIYSLLLQWYGSNTPKVNQDFNPYNGEVTDLAYSFMKKATGDPLVGSKKYKAWAKKQVESELGHALSKKENSKFSKEIEERAIRKYLYDIGGARLQSFSDFLIENSLDYFQMIADLSARQFPLHAYSKEISFNRLFGMTGMKLNMSLIPVVNRAAGEAMAGLNPDGSYAGWGDFERHKMMKGNSFIQSIGWKDALALQLDPRYSKNIGTIAIGISDAHIRKMLSDPLIRMVIPYHSSGMNPDYAKKMNVDYYTDYTDFQNTKVKQYYDLDGNEVSGFGDKAKPDMSWNFNEAAQRLGDARAAAREYIEWCGKRHPVYKSGKKVGEAVFTPKFEQFSDHENYYKLLEDFNMYDAITEEYAPQQGVQMLFPDANNQLSAQELQEYADRLRATGEFTEKDIQKYVDRAGMTMEDIIRKEAADRNKYRRNADANYDKAYNEITDMLNTNFSRLSVDVDAANVGYHAGDLGKAESLGNQSGNRGTGHFGTGTYFVGNEAELTGNYAKRPHETVDFSNYNLYQPGDYKRGMALHEFLKGVNDFFDRGENEARTVEEWERRVDDLRSRLWDREGDQDELIQEATDLFGEYAVEDATDGADDIYDALDRMIDRNGGQAERVVRRYERWHESMPVNDLFGISAEEADDIVRDIRDEIASANYSIQERYTADSASTRFMKRLGYEGVDVRGIQGLDNTMYGSVIYDLKGEALQKKYANGARYSVNVDTAGRQLSASQQEYFANSKTLDDDGRLLVLYHGSTHPAFTEFRTQFGAWLTPLESYAEVYADYWHSWRDDIPGTPERHDLNGLEGEVYNDPDLRIYEVYANIENPLDVGEIDGWLSDGKIREISNAIHKKGVFSELSKLAKDYYEERTYTFTRSPDFLDFVRGHGYDGLMATEKGRKTFCAFNQASQIKLTSNQNPTADDDIRRSVVVDDFFGDDYGRDDYTQMTLSGAGSILEDGAKALKGKAVDEKIIKRVASELRRKYGSTYDLNTFVDNLKKVFAYAQSNDNVDYNDLMNLVREVAQPVIDEATEKVGQEEYDAFLAAIGNQKIRLTDRQKDAVREIFGSYPNFQRAMRGIRINDNGDVTLDQIWNELVDAVPGMLDYDVTEGDMPLNLYDALATLKPTVRNMYGENNEEAAADLAMEIVEQYYEQAGRATGNEAAKAAAQRMREQGKRYRERVRERYNERLKEAKERLKEQRKQYGEKVRADRDQKIAEMRAKNRQRAVDIKERREAARQRDKVSQNAAKLMEWAYNPNDQHHIPKSMLGAVSDFLTAIDFVTPNVRQTKDGKWATNILDHSIYDSSGRFVKNVFRTISANTRQEVLDQYYEMVGQGKGSASVQKWQQRMRKMQDILAHARNEEMMDSHDMDNIVGIIDPALADDLAELLQRNENTLAVSQLGSGDLRTLNMVLTSIMHAANVGENSLTSGESIAEMANATIDMTMNERNKRRAGNGMTNRLFDNLVIDMATPVTYFKLLGGEKVYNILRQGLNRKILAVKEAQEYAKDVMKDVSKRELARWTGKKAQYHAFETVDGTIYLTTGQIMALYELSKREQAMLHIPGGFISFNDGKGRLNNNPNAMHMDRNMIRQITDTLTDEQKRIADELQKFMANQCSAWGNEASNIMYGYDKFTDEDYFPIRTEGTNISLTNRNAQTGPVNGIKNSGFTKKVNQNANNPIVIEDIFDVFTNHVTDMAAYVGYAPALTDVLRWYNYRTVDTNPENSFDYRRTVQGAIQSIFGKGGGRQYFTKLIADINQQETSGAVKTFMDTLLGHYKGTAVAANLSVVIQQPTAFFRAANVINPKYLAKASLSLPQAVKLSKQAQGSSPIAWWKTQGYYEQDLGRGINEILFGGNDLYSAIQEKQMSLAGLADDLTWGLLYKAIQLEQADATRGMSLSQDELQQRVNDRFDEMIDKTQVVDSILHRSQWMRSKDGIAKIVTSFMAEPTKSWNMLMSAYIDDYRSGFNAEGNKALARAVTTFTITGIITAMARSLIVAFRKDDDETPYWERWMESVKSDAVENINPLQLLPVVKDLWEMAEKTIEGSSYTESSRMDMTAANDIMNGAAEFYKMLSGDSKKTPIGSMEAVMKAAGALTGIGFYQFWRDFIKTPYNAFMPNIVTTKAAEKKQAKQFVFKSIDNGGDFKAEIEDAVAKGNSYESIETALTTQYKSQYIELMDSDPEAAKVLENRLAIVYDYLNSQEGQKTGGANKRIQKWYTPAEENVVSETTSEPEETTPAEQEPAQEFEPYVSDYQGVYDAIGAGDDPSKAIKDLLDSGKKASTVKTTITRQYKDDMIELYSSGDMKAASALKQQLIVAYMATGMSRSDANDKINEWLGIK